MKYSRKYTISIFTLILFVCFFTVNTKEVFANGYYECLVRADVSRSTTCADYQSVGHMCQLYQGYDGSGIPDFCSDYCVKRSGVPKECAVVSVQPSSNPEAHKKFTKKLSSKFFTNINLDFLKEKMADSSKLN